MRLNSETRLEFTELVSEVSQRRVSEWCVDEFNRCNHSKLLIDFKARLSHFEYHLFVFRHISTSRLVNMFLSYYYSTRRWHSIAPLAKSSSSLQLYKRYTSAHWFSTDWFQRVYTSLTYSFLVIYPLKDIPGSEKLNGRSKAGRYLPSWHGTRSCLLTGRLHANKVVKLTSSFS